MDSDDYDGYNTEEEKTNRLNNNDGDGPKLQIQQSRKLQKRFIHKYNSSWESHKDFKTWIRSSQKGSLYFSCKVCDEDHIGGISAVRRHGLSKKHLRKCNAIQQSQSLLDMPSTSQHNTIVKKVKDAEVRIAMFIAEHNISFQTADHLVSLIKEIAQNPEVPKKISCNRTKCTAITKNVIGAQTFENLIKDMKCNKFSIIVDESTDRSSIKHLAIVVRMVINLDVRDNFLCLLPVAEATAKNLYKTVIDFFKENAIDYKKQLIGLGADGANVMMGKHTSFQSLLKDDIPNLFVLKCTCHSLALCASYACEKIPNDVEELVRDIYTYLQYSFKRQSIFKEFQKFLEIKPHKILKVCQTRWLSLHACVQRVIEQYDALVLYFQGEFFENQADKKAKSIFTKLKDPTIKMYLNFLDYVLPLITSLNVEFQSEQPKIHELYSKVSAVYRTILDCYIDNDYLKKNDLSVVQYRNPEHFVSLENVYFGGLCMAALSSKELALSLDEKKQFRVNCLNFYVECAHQLYQRFPFAFEFILQLKNLEFIEPKNIDSIITLAPVATYFKSTCSIDIKTLDSEWRKLRNYEISKDVNFLEFWKKVNSVKNGDGTKTFPQICTLVSTILTLPHSSACVERIFSIININKTKTRNCLSSDTLSAIVHCKNCLSQQNKSCFDFTVSDSMLQRHNDNMYKT